MDDNNDNTEVYFDSYEDLDVHRLMLNDKSRTLAYKNTIFNMKDKFTNKIVMDVGAGTGILSIFCAQAGAKKVYAVEASNLAKLISIVAKENNVEQVIDIIEKKVEDIDTNEIEKVDIIVSEWMGFYLVHEGMLDSVIFARDKFLKDDGLMFPSIAKIYTAPCQLPNFNEFWDDIFGVSMKCIAEKYRQSKSSKPEILLIPQEDILAEGKIIVWLDLKTVTSENLDSLGSKVVLACSKNGKYQGCAIWFDVEFPDDSVLSTDPALEPTHWQQTVIVLPTSFDVSRKEPIAFELKFDRNNSNSRRYNVSFTMLDASEVSHEIPCDCDMTKCIVTREYIKNQFAIELDT
ncbi:uncharacterized protein LOC131670508 [Phymastichus coffea]|uniref:uncharacterized protein LOC131670508 n=1 Tax=Phymastichus coffea TaxID=108790 RepID=UPI00273C4F55|nr:uncharacterized protein LOC131670508 [Phymastichus coffea]